MLITYLGNEDPDLTGYSDNLIRVSLSAYKVYKQREHWLGCAGGKVALTYLREMLEPRCKKIHVIRARTLKIQISLRIRAV